MESERFDALSRSFAERTSRRRALGRLGGGGLGAALLGLAGVRSAEVAAGACVLQLTATVDVGAEKKTAYAGELSLTIGPQGAIDEGGLTTADGKTHSIVGQATGRLLGLRVDLGGGKILALTGVGQQDMILCRGRIDGTFSGPKSGDMGTWSAVAGPKTSGSGNGAKGGNGGNAAGTGNATGNGGASGGNSGGGNSAGNGGNSAGSAAPTATTTPGCPACQSLSGGACAPLADGTACGNGSVCCGGQCFDTRQFDGDNANCGGCGIVCPTGQFCSNGACGTCAQLGDRCNADTDCCSTFCNQGGCDQLTCSAGTALCQNQCVDTRQFDTDNANCGACGNVCPAGQFCSNGACGTCAQLGDRCNANTDCCSTFCNQGGCDQLSCPAGQTACGGVCVDTSSNAGNCGACGTSCALGAVCTGGTCVAPVACLPDGAVCNLDADCCGGFCIVGVLGNPNACSH